MKKVVLQVIDVVKKATRAEDELYQLDGDEITFALLMLTKKEGINVIRDRLKERIAQIDTNDILNTRQLMLDMSLAWRSMTGRRTRLSCWMRRRTPCSMTFKGMA